MTMRIARIAVVVALSLAGAIGAVAASFAQTAPAATPPPSAVPVLMTMGDLMNTLVQPRHVKLGLAGQAQNWPLAKYALEQLRAAFANIVSAKPKFAGMPVGDLVDVAVMPPLNAVDAAIKQQDSQKFAAAYEQLSQGCNACHMELDHPYVVIKPADVSAFPDQEFKPQR